MAFIIDAKTGGRQEVKLEPTIFAEARDNNLRLEHLLNEKFPDADPKYGTAFKQLAASVGLAPVGKNPLGLTSPTLDQILDGKGGYDAAVSNSRKRSDPYGQESRILFPHVVLDMVEDMWYDSRSDEDIVFRDLVKTTVPIAGDYYKQPVLSYNTPGGAHKGANAAKAARVTQMGELPNLLTITTSERGFNIPAYGIGIEMSEDAMKGTTLDMFGLTMKRYIDIEHNGRVYGYLSNLFLGDQDQNNGAVNSVTTAQLDAASTGGKVTHRAWLKFLARNRRRRKITHMVCDLDTYLAIESREGRPGSNNYDPTLARIDPQLRPMNNGMVGFGNDVKWMIIDSAAEGGPVPANTVWALDQAQAIKLVTNTEAEYKATEDFVLRRSSRMVWTWSEEALRLFGDTDLSAFDVLVISQ